MTTKRHDVGAESYRVQVWNRAWNKSLTPAVMSYVGPSRLLKRSALDDFGRQGCLPHLTASTTGVAVEQASLPASGVWTFSARKAGGRVWPRVERFLRNPGNTAKEDKPAKRATEIEQARNYLSPASRALVLSWRTQGSAKPASPWATLSCPLCGLTRATAGREMPSARARIPARRAARAAGLSQGQPLRAPRTPRAASEMSKLQEQASLPASDFFSSLLGSWLRPQK
jgi:hypothetical protein